MRPAAILSAILLAALAGCSTTRDPHAPRTITAGHSGGSITVKHGQRLFVPLPAEPQGGQEWRRVEPMIMRVVAVGAPLPEGMWFTPVRSGSETLRLEYRALPSDVAAAQKAVSYEITVP